MVSVWARFTRSGSFEWAITIFMLATLPNTAVAGLPILVPMFKDLAAEGSISIIISQGLVWYNVCIILYEIRAARLEINCNAETTGGGSVHPVATRIHPEECSDLSGTPQVSICLGSPNSPSRIRDVMIHNCNILAVEASPGNLRIENSESVSYIVLVPGDSLNRCLQRRIIPSPSPLTSANQALAHGLPAGSIPILTRLNLVNVTPCVDVQLQDISLSNTAVRHELIITATSSRTSTGQSLTRASNAFLIIDSKTCSTLSPSHTQRHYPVCTYSADWIISIVSARMARGNGENVWVSIPATSFVILTGNALTVAVQHSSVEHFEEDSGHVTPCDLSVLVPGRPSIEITLQGSVAPEPSGICDENEDGKSLPSETMFRRSCHLRLVSFELA